MQDVSSLLSLRLFLCVGYTYRVWSLLRMRVDILEIPGRGFDSRQRGESDVVAQQVE